MSIVKEIRYAIKESRLRSTSVLVKRIDLCRSDLKLLKSELEATMFYLPSLIDIEDSKIGTNFGLLFGYNIYVAVRSGVVYKVKVKIIDLLPKFQGVKF